MTEPKVEEILEVGKIYLASRAYNSKTMTWEACRLDAILETSFLITFLEDGMERTISKVNRNVRRRAMEYRIIEEPTLKPVTRTWMKREQDDINKTMRVLAKRQTAVLMVFDQLNGTNHRQAHR